MRLSRQFSSLAVFVKKYIFLNGPSKLVFVRIYGSTFTGLVGPPYPYYSLVAFYVLFGFIARTKTLTNKN